MLLKNILKKQVSIFHSEVQARLAYIIYKIEMKFNKLEWHRSKNSLLFCKTKWSHQSSATKSNQDMESFKRLPLDG